MSPKFVTIASHPEIAPLIRNMTLLRLEGIQCYINNNKDLVSFTSTPYDLYELQVPESQVERAIELLRLGAEDTQMFEPKGKELPRNSKTLAFNAMPYRIIVEKNSIILVKNRFHITFPFVFTAIISTVFLYILLAKDFHEEFVAGYLLGLPPLLIFLKELHSFCTETVYRIDFNKGYLYRNTRKYIAFSEIAGVWLSITNRRGGNESYYLELIVNNRVNFLIGESNDIRLYEIGQKIASMTGAGLEVK